MNISIKHFGLIVIIFFGVLVSCSDDNKPGTTSTSIDLKKAFLTDFSFSEVNYISIDITQPEIQNNIETKFGEIKIRIPKESASIKLSLKETNFDQASFTISPAIGEKKSFSATDPVVYSIASSKDPNQLIHYKVLLILDTSQSSETPEVTSFKFEKIKNTALLQDVEAAKIDKEKKQIFIFVPIGTDFSNLTPTITFKGEKLYSINGIAKEEYPGKGQKTDFKYPKTFSIQVESEAGNKSQFYSVIVDVKNPIKFEATTVDVTNVKKSSDFFKKTGTFINQGNHPITVFATTYKNKIPDLSTGNIGLITLNVPGGGLVPGASGDVMFSLNKSLANVLSAGTYQFTSVSPPGFANILSWPPDASQLLESSDLIVKVNLIE